MAEERYKWDGKCPDCGAELDQKREHNNYSVFNRIFFDCLKCGYCSDGWVRSDRKLNWKQELYYKNWKPSLFTIPVDCDVKKEKEMKI
jgi:ssDNA-binding Zn-finger/Zn-ribbon topoisomerase 1